MNRELPERVLDLQRKDLAMREWLLREGRLFGDAAEYRRRAGHRTRQVGWRE